MLRTIFIEKYFEYCKIKLLGKTSLSEPKFIVILFQDTFFFKEYFQVFSEFFKKGVSFPDFAGSV